MLLCLIHTDSLPELPKNFLGIPLDKLTHFIMFCPFAVLGYSAFYPTEKTLLREMSVIGLLVFLGCFFALATERLQAITSYRSYELQDIVADTVGIASGALATVAYIVTRYK